MYRSPGGTIRRVSRPSVIRCYDRTCDGARAGSRERSYTQRIPAMVPMVRQPLRSCTSWHFAIAGCIYEQHQRARHAATTAVVLRRNRVTPNCVIKDAPGVRSIAHAQLSTKMQHSRCSVEQLETSSLPRADIPMADHRFEALQRQLLEAHATMLDARSRVGECDARGHPALLEGNRSPFGVSLPPHR